MGSGQCILRELLRTLKYFEFLAGGDVREEAGKEVLQLFVTKIKPNTDLPSYFQGHRVETILREDLAVLE